ncbi:MarR family transcriptional regulator [Sedimentibacter sp. zth1]|uniref:MarR family winged helix-turn-helix transcriptional regulator n=1 Tax=Sedimentibacter sp. zth1 TaxID=2816908 RepID=UPI001A91EFF4|nr:MarR family transcriptional regulator [Sedimentibacter sp. zth1]QSX06477.1 MarR family transcriptional regulator [Sedimentibacter sp. zth1]
MEETSKALEILRTFREVMKTLKKNIKCQYKEVNLTGAQGMMMGILAHNEKMKISDLSEKLNLSNSTVSGIVDRLEKQGLVERVRSKEDRRVVYVNITPEFKKIAEEKFKEAEKEIEIKMSRASDEELDRILQGLNSLKKILD